MPRRARVRIAVSVLATCVLGTTAGTPGASGQSRNSPIDLIQTSCVVPAKITVGKKFRVMDDVENAGTEFSVESVTYFYLSANNEIDNQDIVIGGRRVPGLGPGQRSSYPSMVLLPEGVPPGEYYVIARANADGRIEERYVSNNTVATKTTVLAPDKK